MGNALARYHTRHVLSAASTGSASAIATALKQSSQVAYMALTWSQQNMWHLAARHGYVQLLQALCCTVTQCCQRPDGSKLMAKHDNVEAVLLGLINSADIKGATPLMIAATHGQIGCLQYLLSLGADPWQQDCTGRTAMHYAASFDHPDCINALATCELAMLHSYQQQAGGDTQTWLVNLQNHSGLSPLHYAAWRGALGAVQALLAHDARQDLRNSTPAEDEWLSCTIIGCTPLHLAAVRGDLNVARALLMDYVLRVAGGGAQAPGVGAPAVQLPPDPRASLNYGHYVPYQVARDRGHYALAQMILSDIPLSHVLDSHDLEDLQLMGPPRLATLAASALHRKLLCDLDAAEAGLPRAGSCSLAEVQPLAPAAAAAGRPRGSRGTSAVKASIPGKTGGRFLRWRRREVLRRLVCGGQSQVCWANRYTAVLDQCDSSKHSQLGSQLMMSRHSSVQQTPDPSLRAGAAAALLLATTSGRPSPAATAADLVFTLEEVDVEQLLASPCCSDDDQQQQQHQQGQQLQWGQQSQRHACEVRWHADAGARVLGGRQQLLDRSGRRCGSRAGLQGLALEGAFEGTKNASKASLAWAAGSRSPSQHDPTNDSVQAGGSWHDWSSCHGQRCEDPAAGRDRPSACRYDDDDDDDVAPDLDQDPPHWPELPQLLASRRGALCPSPATASSSQGDPEGDTCGVCLDASVQVCTGGCRHRLCLACSRELVRLHCLKPAVCPFCREVISGFGGLEA